MAKRKRKKFDPKKWITGPKKLGTDLYEFAYENQMYGGRVNSIEYTGSYWEGGSDVRCSIARGAVKELRSFGEKKMASRVDKVVKNKCYR
jgi:hypothetical protein